LKYRRRRGNGGGRLEAGEARGFEQGGHHRLETSTDESGE
ncbi:MAG: hypothetical protein JWO71_512, partial [Candidatus Acidoferrum typicum]|nr:hypothetical protein [Candidatus Acidoferrum typicum]